MQKLIKILIVFLFLLCVSYASPNEAHGIVTKVVDGDTIDVQDFGRVRLADIDCPEMDSPLGRIAAEYTMSMLYGKTVYLDVDDLTGKDNYGRWVCVVYLSNQDGSENTTANFNRMLVDNDKARLVDFTNNEFDPSLWWNDEPKTGESGSNDNTINGQYTETSSNLNSGNTDHVFVGSVKSNKYHYPSCRYAKKILPENEIWFSGSEDARRHGYVPCSVCSPP